MRWILFGHPRNNNMDLYLFAVSPPHIDRYDLLRFLRSSINSAEVTFSSGSYVSGRRPELEGGEKCSRPNISTPATPLELRKEVHAIV
jgi:hypothetical protein